MDDLNLDLYSPVKKMVHLFVDLNQDSCSPVEIWWMFFLKFANRREPVIDQMGNN